MPRDLVPGVGRRVLELRKAAGLTQAELCERASLGVSNLSKIETEERMPTVRVLLELAEALDVTLNDLMPGKRKRGA